MSKVYGLHTIALKPGVKAEDFERFIAETIPSWPSMEGAEMHFLKGDRGDREGRYLWLIEFASLEARQRYFPAPGEVTEEAQHILASMTKISEKWVTYTTPINIIYTDYVTVGD
jgi:hypothetical protein